LEEFDFDDIHQFSLEEFDSLRPELGLGREEPDSWSAAIGRKVAMRLVDNNEREVKRQEHIYEFILTEKHHCLVLLAMQRIFVEGLQRHFNLNFSVLDRMFPKLQNLMDIHFDFLSKLRLRQSENAVVPTIADILIDQFSGDNSYSMKSAYGEFCSRHRDAVDVYKQHQQVDTRFARFVRHCQVALLNISPASHFYLSSPRFYNYRTIIIIIIQMRTVLVQQAKFIQALLLLLSDYDNVNSLMKWFER
jgi:hypothetical protein